MSPHIIKMGQFRVHVNWDIAISCFVLWCVLVALGAWQLERDEDKNGFLFNQQQRAKTPVVELEALGQGKPSQQQSIRVTGQFDDQRYFYLVGQRHLGQEGAELISPFYYGDGKLVFVSRGWLADADEIPTEELPTQIVTYVAPPSPDFLLKEPLNVDEWPAHIHAIDVSAMGRLFDEAVYPYLLRLEPQSEGMLTNHWASQIYSTRSNWLYAMQWFAFAAMLVLILLVKSSNIVALLRSVLGR